MDEIKFRAWAKLNKKMYPNPFNEKISGMNDIFSNVGDWIYLQYTGQTDKDDTTKWCKIIGTTYDNEFKVVTEG